MAALNWQLSSYGTYDHWEFKLLLVYLLSLAAVFCSIWRDATNKNKARLNDEYKASQLHLLVWNSHVLRIKLIDWLMKIDAMTE